MSDRVACHNSELILNPWASGHILRHKIFYVIMILGEKRYNFTFTCPELMTAYS